MYGIPFGFCLPLSFTALIIFFNFKDFSLYFEKIPSMTRLKIFRLSIHRINRRAEVKRVVVWLPESTMTRNIVSFSTAPFPSILQPDVTSSWFRFPPWQFRQSGSISWILFYYSILTRRFARSVVCFTALKTFKDFTVIELSYSTFFFSSSFPPSRLEVWKGEKKRTAKKRKSAGKRFPLSRRESFCYFNILLSFLFRLLAPLLDTHFFISDGRNAL